MNYIQDVQEAVELLEDSKATYVQLLEKLCELERLYGELKELIKMGFNEDIETLWEIGATVDRIKSKIKHRVKKLADKSL